MRGEFQLCNSLAWSNILQEEEMHDAGTQTTEAFAGGDFREL